MNILLSTNTFNVDFILLIILAVYLIVGLWRGFVNYIFGIIGTVVAFILAFIFCDDLVTMLEPTSLYQSLISFFDGIFSSNGNKSLAEMNLPQWIIDAVNAMQQAGSSINLSDALSITLTKLLLSFVCFLFILIIVKIICFVLKFIFKALTELPLIGIVNRLLGALVGLINGALVISAVIYIISIIPASALDNVRASIQASAVANFIMNNNIFAVIFKFL